MGVLDERNLWLGPSFEYPTPYLPTNRVSELVLDSNCSNVLRHSTNG